MNENLLLLVLLMNLTINSNCQNLSKEQAAKNNFERFFQEFKSEYPADKFEYTFYNYSPLDSIFAFPEILITLSEMEKIKDSNTFFSIVTDQLNGEIQNFMGQINIADLNLPTEISLNYRVFVEIINNGNSEDGFDIELANQKSKELANMLESATKPFIGYVQIVQSKSQNKQGNKNESKMHIQYNIDLEVVSFGIIQD